MYNLSELVALIINNFGKGYTPIRLLMLLWDHRQISKKDIEELLERISFEEELDVES